MALIFQEDYREVRKKCSHSDRTSILKKSWETYRIGNIPIAPALCGYVVYVPHEMQNIHR